ncbi:phage tail tape measure protein [Croceicoccus sp. YJ47]|uniref:phage tail tape measure protein n=1 Tax=Croceicoccus sp. YJ47 TaxID=2798724 RepID=UPI001922BE79|nr:phage tail tape measure protein [Croceicoccus sp. YJ47]QQN73157.1 phage tail tape measure protein [Croceicoccus sp. YJ47]
MDNRLNLVVNFAQAGLDTLQGGLRNLVGLGRRGGDTIKDMARESRKLEKELKDVRQQLVDGMADGERQLSELAQQERKLTRDVETANDALRRQRNLMQIDNRAADIRAHGDRMMSRGRDNIVGGVSILAPIVLAARAGGEFSSTLVDIQQKAELTDRAMVGVRNNITAAAEAGKQMPADMAFAVDTLAGLGMAVEDAATLSAPMARFMTAFKVEGTDAAAAIFSGLKTMNIPLAQTGKLLDMMAEGGNVGAFEVKDMAAALPSLTAQMKALGQTGTDATAELIAMLETVRGGAGSSEQAATQASDLLTKLTAPATVSAFAKNFGLDVPAAIKKGAEAGITPLETMIALTRQATGGDLSKIGYAFADKESAAAMRTLIQNYDAFAAAKDKVGAAAGVTDRAFDQRVANDQTIAWRELSVAMSNLVLSVSPVLLPFLRTLTDQLSAGAQWVTAFANKHPAAAGMMLKLVTALALGKVALGGLQFAFGGLLKPMATAYGYFKKVEGVSRFSAHLVRAGSVLTKFKSIAGAAFRFLDRANMMLVRGVQAAAPLVARGFTIMRSAALFLARGVMRAGAMMLANPIVLAIVAIVAALGLAGYMIYKHWDTIRAAFSNGVAMIGAAWTQISGAFDTGIEWVKTRLSGFGSWMASIGRAMMDGLLLAINPMALASKLVGMAKTGVTAFKKYLGIKSPSRLFMAMGGHIAEGAALGIDRRSRAAQNSARRLALGVAGAASIAAMPAAAGDASPASRLALRAPIAAIAPIARGQSIAPAARAAQSASASSDRYEFNIYAQPGQSAEDIARAVRAELDRREREAAARRRSSFGDD